MKHTQGEWKIYTANDGYSYTKMNDEIPVIEVSIKGEWIAYVRGNDLEQTTANAKLIAAAPDLLDALNQLMQVYETKRQLLAFDVNIARQAIKKATE